MIACCSALRRRILIGMICLMGALSAFAAERPNVVIIYGDDVGFGDVGFGGSKMIPTPNFDELARGGLMFTDGHCSSSVCSPSRYAMLTGQHPLRLAPGVISLSPEAGLSIKTEQFTLADLFRKAGYHTAVIGKWHLGIGPGKEKGGADWNGEVKPGPLEIGFDYSFLVPSTNDRVPCVYLRNHRVLNLDPEDPLYIASKPITDKPGSTQYPDGRKTPEAMTTMKSVKGHNSSVINGIGRIGYMVGGKSAKS